MKPKRIILVRHGESQANVEPSHYETIPDYAFDLTEQGHAQAQQAGESIAEIIGDESIRAYVSLWYRTRQTYDEIKFKLGNQMVKVCEDPRLREQEWGHFQNVDEMKHAEQERIQYSTVHFITVFPVVNQGQMFMIG